MKKSYKNGGAYGHKPVSAQPYMIELGDVVEYENRYRCYLHIRAEKSRFDQGPEL